MKKVWNQVAYNLKKDRSSYISFGIIILITALILNCAAVLLVQVDPAYVAKFEKLNTADINVLVPEFRHNSDVEAALAELDGIEKAESHEALFLEATVRDFLDTDFAMNTVFYKLEETRTMNTFEMVSEGETEVKNPIYVPLYICVVGGFQVGDEITYVLNGKTHIFTVAGVIEEMQYGNYGASMMCAYLPEDGFQALAAELDGKAVVEYSLTLREGADLEKTKETVSKELEKEGAMMLSCLDRQKVKTTRNQVCNLLILILTAFALIILAVSVFLSNFRVKNAIESEIVNMSVLKALGYTSGQIVAGISMPYAMVALLFSALGVGASYAVLPLLASVLTFQSGFSFAVAFDFVSLAAVVGVLTLVVTFFTVISAGKIKKTQPIDGLRGNTGSKQHKRNPLPLAETRGNTQILLVLKQMFACKKQNVLLFLVCFALTVLVAFSGTLFYNVAIKPENFMSALSDETPDVIVYSENADVTTLQNKLLAEPNVENALQYVTGSVKIGDKTSTVFACEDFSKTRNDVCYEGKNPQKADEIALGNAFAENYNIGDTVTVKLGEQAKVFKVTGFVQSVNLNGELCTLSMAGYESLSEGTVTPSLYVYLKENADAAAFISRIEERYADMVAQTANAQKLMEEAQSMYMGITVVLTIVIFIVTVLIVLFILYIVIKSLLIKRRQELGIYKAMGYTSAQLIWQTAGSFMPVSVAAILLSSVAAIFYMPGIFQVIFEALGVMKHSMEVSLGFLMLFAAVEIILNLMISIILCMPIRKISAYALIKE